MIASKMLYIEREWEPHMPAGRIPRMRILTHYSLVWTCNDRRWKGKREKKKGKKKKGEKTKQDEKVIVRRRRIWNFRWTNEKVADKPSDWLSLWPRTHNFTDVPNTLNFAGIGSETSYKMGYLISKIVAILNKLRMYWRKHYLGLNIRSI
jgi:hypothetical protein